MRKTMVLAWITLIFGLVFIGCPGGRDPTPAPQPLAAPVIALEGSVVSWVAVSGAGGYSVRIAGIQVEGGALGATVTSFDLADLDLAPGDYLVTVVALGIANVSLDSPASNAVPFTVTPAAVDPQPLPAPVIALADTVVSWVAVTGAGGYSVRIAGTQVEGGALGAAVTSFDLAPLNLGVGDHLVTVVALGVANVSLDSPASNEVPFTVTPAAVDPQPLPAPVITLTDTVVSWAAVPGADGYSVRIAGTQVEGGALGATVTSFDLATLELEPGDHPVTVVALGVDNVSLDSPASNAVTFTVAPAAVDPQPLPAPVIALADTVVSWAAVPGAGGYSVRIAGYEVEDGALGATVTSFDLADLDLAPGDYVVTVVALGVANVSLDSPSSNEVIFTVPAAYPSLTITFDEFTNPIGDQQIVFNMIIGTDQYIEVPGFDTVRWYRGITRLEEGDTLYLDEHITGAGRHLITARATVGNRIYSQLIAIRAVNP